jgi:hypothetical protein
MAKALPGQIIADANAGMPRANNNNIEYGLIHEQI